RRTGERRPRLALNDAAAVRLFLVLRSSFSTCPSSCSCASAAVVALLREASRPVDGDRERERAIVLDGRHEQKAAVAPYVVEIPRFIPVRRRTGVEKRHRETV